MRVGINFEDLALHWQGGINYYNNLFAALAIRKEDELIGFCGTDKYPALQQAMPDLKLLTTPLLKSGHPLNMIRRVIRKVTGTDWLLDFYLRQHQIDVLTHSSPLGAGARTPSAAWIPDFQHVHLPHLFTAAELEVRDRSFKKICIQSDAVFVSSQAAANDLIAFEPSAKDKCKVLRFCIRPIQENQLPSELEIRTKYDLSGDYFYIPNQFWPHKNHMALMRAIDLLCAMLPSPPLFIFSGAMEQANTNPNLAEILDFQTKRDLERCVRFLGSIPYKDVLSLANNSLAIINPSLFEGWSTSVEEAKELRKYMLLSNLPVNMEQIQEGVAFFNPADPTDIANVIHKFIKQNIPASARFERSGRITLESFGQTLSKHLRDLLLS